MSSLHDDLELLEAMYPDKFNVLSPSQYELELHPRTGGESKREFVNCTVLIKVWRDEEGLSDPFLSGFELLKSAGLDETQQKSLIKQINFLVNEEDGTLFEGVTLCEEILSEYNTELSSECPICLCPFYDDDDDDQQNIQQQTVHGNNTHLFRLSSCVHAVHRKCVRSYWESCLKSENAKERVCVCPVCRLNATREDLAEIGLLQMAKKLGVMGFDGESASKKADSGKGGDEDYDESNDVAKTSGHKKSGCSESSDKNKKSSSDSTNQNLNLNEESCRSLRFETSNHSQFKKFYDEVLKKSRHGNSDAIAFEYGEYYSGNKKQNKPWAWVRFKNADVALQIMRKYGAQYCEEKEGVEVGGGRWKITYYFDGEGS